MKWKIIVVLPLLNATVFAAIPLTVKSLASTVPGSAAPLRLTVKSVGAGPTTMLPQSEPVTEHPGGVGVGVGVGLIVAAQYLPPVFNLPGC